MLIFFVKEPQFERRTVSIDWAGAALLTSGMSTLLWIVLDGSRHGLAYNGGGMAAAVVLLVLFVIRERVAADPILPMDLMMQSTIAASLVGSFLVGCILFGLDTYIPLYIQGVGGGTATMAGRALMPLFLAWAVSVAVAARAVVHFGFRRGGMIGSALIAVGNLILVIGASFPEWSRLWFMIGLAVCGLGMGPTSLSFILAVQHLVSWGQRGVATGAVTFVRTIGGAIGVGLLGATLGWELAHRLALAGGDAIDITSALRPETHKFLTSAQLALVQSNLGLTLRDVYIQLMVLGIGCLVCAYWLPDRDATLSHSSTHERESPEDAGLNVAVSEF
jgi:MFS family permease